MSKSDRVRAPYPPGGTPYEEDLRTRRRRAPAVRRLAACGGSDSGSSTTETTAAATPAETTAETTEPTTEATTGEAGSAVEAYCQQVEEYAAEAKELMADPTSGNAADLQAKAQELQDTASQLTQELIDDPSQATRVQECTTKLQEALAG